MWTPPGAADAECVDIGNDLASTVMTLVEVHVVEIVVTTTRKQGH